MSACLPIGIHEPQLSLIEGHVGPCCGWDAPEEFIPSVNLSKVWNICRKLSTISLKANSRKGQRAGALNIRNDLFEPIETRNVFRTLGIVAQGE